MSKRRKRRKRAVQQKVKRAEPLQRGEDRGGILRLLLRNLPVFLFLLLMTLLLRHFGMMHKLETIVLDTKMRLAAPVAASQVAIVNITDEDYEKIFEARSPLDPSRLQELIRAISLSQPKVIGVDVDTSPKQFREMEIDESAGAPQIVWEREVKELPENAEQGDLEPLDVVGGKDPALNEHNSGLALLLDDPEDKVTRRYKRFFARGRERLKSFPWTLVEKFQTDPAKLLEPSTDELLINYAGDRQTSQRLHMTASSVLELAREKGWREDVPLKGKLVLLGGSYLGQDRHDTPFGQMNGVEILAQVVETELSGGGHRVPGTPVIVLLELFDVCLLALLAYWLRKRSALFAFGVKLALVVALALACSLIAYGSLSQWPMFALLMLGVIIYQWFEHYRKEKIIELWDDFSEAHHSESHTH
jgi:CHASE2 domain-containing sensor protein